MGTHLYSRKNKKKNKYCIYPVYLVTLSPYHTSPKNLNKLILLPVNVSKVSLGEWQTV